ncbi:MAG: hypothetical protein DRJ63_03190 [Thermoprotei archaeon]|nr:MAG: hypothetical protein DRJ63_03190 [Thermoprotei archaeon]
MATSTFLVSAPTKSFASLTFINLIEKFIYYSDLKSYTFYYGYTYTSLIELKNLSLKQLALLMKPKARGKSIEEICEKLLIEKGYDIVARNYRIKISGIDVAEVDILAEKKGEKYVVEAKAGRATVTDIRQVYCNAALLNAKPLLVCRGFADKASEETARALSVKVLFLPDFYIFMSPEELAYVIKSIVREALLETLFAEALSLSEEDFKILKAIAESSSFIEASEKLKLSPEELGHRLSSLKRRGILRKGDYSSLRLQAAAILERVERKRLFEKLEEVLSTLRELCNK